MTGVLWSSYSSIVVSIALFVSKVNCWDRQRCMHTLKIKSERFDLLSIVCVHIA